MTKECLRQSSGAPQTYLLRDGREVALRNGCLVDESSPSREVITKSYETKQFVLDNAVMADEERSKIQLWGDVMCLSGAHAGYMTLSEARRNKA